MKQDIVKKIALTAGITWSALIFITTLASVFFGYGKSFLEVVSSIYPGYSISIIGTLIGLIYGFIDAYICIYIIFWIYNKVAE